MPTDEAASGPPPPEVPPVAPSASPPVGSPGPNGFAVAADRREVRDCLVPGADSCSRGLRPLDRVVFVLRQSPDWAELARDHEAGLPVSPSRYRPPGFIEGFPGNIEEWIRSWNELFPVNFFRCRQILKDVAVGLLRSVDRAVVLSESDVSTLPSVIGNRNFLLFFLDDDDWFAPDTFARIARLDLRGRPVAVFPLVRFDTSTFTFVRASESARTLVGARQDFHFRFQTNNYALGRSLALSGDLLRMKDHVEASRFADSAGIEDTYFPDVVISATNKTPASASRLPGLLADPSKSRSRLRDYVRNLEELSIPDELGWCESALRATIGLFRLIADPDPKSRAPAPP